LSTPVQGVLLQKEVVVVGAPQTRFRLHIALDQLEYEAIQISRRWHLGLVFLSFFSFFSFTRLTEDGFCGCPG
jgi:hypothetical protein